MSSLKCKSVAKDYKIWEIGTQNNVQWEKWIYDGHLSVVVVVFFFFRSTNNIFIWRQRKGKQMWNFKLFFFTIFYFIFTTNLRFSIYKAYPILEWKRGKIFFLINSTAVISFRIPYFIFENDILHQRSKAVK